jgi:ribosomal silencing factor RsfS
MATLKQFEANRRNSQKSTGPQTPEGKSAVSMNALRHGLRARSVVLPGEDPTEFHQLCDDLQAEWTPQSRTEQFYVEQMAVSQWKLTRMEVVEVNIFKDTDAKSQLSMLDRLWQAECRLERSFARAQRELERLQKSRPQPVEPPEDPAPAEAAVVGQAFSPVAEPSEIQNPTSEIQPNMRGQ